MTVMSNFVSMVCRHRGWLVTKRVLLGAVLLSLLPSVSEAQSLTPASTGAMGLPSGTPQSPPITTAEWERRHQLASHRRGVAAAITATAIALVVTGSFLAVRGE